MKPNSLLHSIHNMGYAKNDASPFLFFLIFLEKNRFYNDDGRKEGCFSLMRIFYSTQMTICSDS